jgi:hypothetical protein
MPMIHPIARAAANARYTVGGNSTRSARKNHLSHYHLLFAHVLISGVRHSLTEIVDPYWLVCACLDLYSMDPMWSTEMVGRRKTTILWFPFLRQ